MGAILGVSAFYHDSAVCLVRDGDILAAAQEERFSGVVGDARLPRSATVACLDAARIDPSEVERIVFYEKPLLKLERILQNHLEMAPRGLWQWRMLGRRLWSEKFGVEQALRQLVPGFRGEVGFVEHHESHAASAYFPSPFSEAAVLTIDGVGEWATATWGVGSGTNLELREELRWPHSVGLLYSAVTAALGFRVNRDEYKVMGLAAYGQPTLVDWLDESVVERRDDGSCRLRPELLAYRHGRSMIAPAFLERLGGPVRRSDGSPTDLAMDLAASIQRITEDQVLAMARYVERSTGLKNLCLAGGVLNNCVANGRLRSEGPFRELWIQPACGDAGGALGAAILGWYRTHPKAERRPTSPDSMQDALLGPTIDSVAARTALGSHGLELVAEGKTLCDQTAADLLAEGHIVAVASGRMEFGPRALGNRSILADARVPSIQQLLNAKVKHRESFRPFAPAVLEEHASTVFRRATPSPYMLETTATRNATDGGVDWSQLISGAVHVDGSARLQTVGTLSGSRLRGILEAFERRTGCPVLINTSFNVADMPIAAGAEEACSAMERTDIQYLILGDFLVRRADAAPRAVRDADAALTSSPLRALWSRSRRLLRLGPDALADAVLFAAFVFIICPMAALYRLEARRSRDSATSGWIPRARPASDLDRLF